MLKIAVREGGRVRNPAEPLKANNVPRPKGTYKAPPAPKSRLNLVCWRIVEQLTNPLLEFSWITEKLAVGGGIWNAENMAEIARLGFTHIIDMQIEFDDTALAEPYGIAVLWNPTDDDFKPKPPSLFRRGVEFALAALYPGSPSRAAMYQISRQEAAAVMNGKRIRYPARDALVDDPGARIYIHCAAGVHRAPMMTLAILRATGWSLTEAADLLVSRRPVADLADVYVRSVETFVQSLTLARGQKD